MEGFNFQHREPALSRFVELFKQRSDGLKKGEISESDEFWLNTNKQALLTIFNETQHINRFWAEGQFRTIREGKDWSYDILLVDQLGKQVVRPWSTYRAYSYGRQLPPDLMTIFRLNLESHPLSSVFPIIPRLDTTLFWFLDQERDMKKLLAPELNEGTIIEDYPTHKDIVNKIPSPIRMARIPRGRVGVKQAAKNRIALGRLGFWANWEGSQSQRYIPRVYFDSDSFIGRAVISPIAADQLVESGGIPMDQKHGIPVARTDPDEAKVDFIAIALKNAYQVTRKAGYAFTYTTPRTWKREGPAHGPRKQP